MPNLSLSNLALIILIFFVSCTNKPVTGLNPGNLAPDFALKDLNGQEIKLSDFRGKKVLLNFWASWCEPCVAEAPYLEELQQSNQNIIILGVAVDDEHDAVAEFIKRFSLSFTTLMDDESKVKSLYKVGAYPETFLINEEGKIQLILDPMTGLPEAKIKGTRDWASPEFSKQLK